MTEQQFQGYLTVREIAKLIDHPRKDVQNWLDEGKLKAVKLGKTLGVEEGEFHRFATHHLGYDIPATIPSLQSRVDSLELDVEMLKQELAVLKQRIQGGATDDRTEQ